MRSNVNAALLAALLATAGVFMLPAQGGGSYVEGVVTTGTSLANVRPVSVGGQTPGGASAMVKLGATGGVQIEGVATEDSSTGPGSPFLVAGKDSSGVVRIPNVTPAGSALGATPRVIPLGVKDTAGNAQALRADTSGNAFEVPLDSQLATYSACGSFSPPTGPLDSVRITGSATKTVKVRAIAIVATQTTASLGTLFLTKRSSLHSGGVFVSATATPHDSSSSAATVTVGHWTTSPDLGTPAAPGNVRIFPIMIPNQTTAVSGAPGQFFFALSRTDQPIVLRGASQELDVGFNGVTYAGLVVNYAIEWTEE